MRTLCETTKFQVNECSNLVHNFAERGVDGMKFLTSTKQEIMSLVNNKMGPCLKIEHLQKLLKVSWLALGVPLNHYYYHIHVTSHFRID